MSAIQASLLTLDMQKARPPLRDHARPEKPERSEKPERPERPEPAQKKDKPELAEDVSVEKVPFAELMALAESETTQASLASAGNVLPDEQANLPLADGLASPVDSEESAGDAQLLTAAGDDQPIVDTELEEQAAEAVVLPITMVSNQKLEKGGKVSLAVNADESSQTKQTDAIQLKAATSKVSGEQLDAQGKFFNPTESVSGMAEKPGNLSLLEQRSTGLKPSTDEGLFTLRNMTPVSQPAAPINAPTSQTPATAVADMIASQGQAVKSDINLLQLNGRAQDFPTKFTQQVAIVVGRGLQQAMIRLDPPELGRLEVNVQKDEDRVQVQIVTQTPQARELVERNLNQLKELFTEQGMQLTDADVQQDEQSDHSGQSQQSSGGPVTDGEVESEVEQTVQVSNQLLDTYA